MEPPFQVDLFIISTLVRVDKILLVLVLDHPPHGVFKGLETDGISSLHLAALTIPHQGP